MVRERESTALVERGEVESLRTKDILFTSPVRAVRRRGERKAGRGNTTHHKVLGLVVNNPRGLPSSSPSPPYHSLKYTFTDTSIYLSSPSDTQPLQKLGNPFFKFNVPYTKVEQDL
jgi:hypothetical protein